MLLVAICCFVSCVYAYRINRHAGRLPAHGPDQQAPAASSDPVTVALDPYPEKTRISFNEDGAFKLTVFSDVHFGENPWDSWGPEQDINTTALMKKLLKIETPDYVVINGDLITGEDTFRENSTSLIDSVVRPLMENGTSHANVTLDEDFK